MCKKQEKEEKNLFENAEEREERRCRCKERDPEELEDLIINKCRLWLDSGKIFGKCGSGFQRINAACPRVVLNTALERIKTELNAYKYNEGKK